MAFGAGLFLSKGDASAGQSTRTINNHLLRGSAAIALALILNVPTGASGPSAAAQIAPRPALTSLPPLEPKAGSIIGRTVDGTGAAVSNVTVSYSGFEDGKLIINGSENVRGEAKGEGGAYAIKVPPGAYRVVAYARYSYHGRTYNFEMEPLNPPSRHDFNGLGLDKLRGGLVRDFVLKMTAKKALGREDSESGFINAYHGGRVDISCGEVEGILGGGHATSAALVTAYPSDSRIRVILVPQGPLVDGSTGGEVTIDLPLGDQGLYRFCQRGIFPGTYLATASLTTPTGETVPLRLSLSRARTVLNGSPDGYDMLVMDWKSSALLEFVPNDLGLKPITGVRAIGLFLGK